MAEIPQNIINQFFEAQGIKNLVIDDYGFTSSLSAHGDFGKYKGKELAVFRLAVLLSTLEGSYINDPDLGVNLIRYIYKPMNEANVNAIRDELQRKIAKYEKDLFLTNITLEKDTTYKTIYFKLFLKYLPNDEDIVLDFDFIKDLQSLILKSI